MNFFDIGPLEILMILVIALLVFGPDKLPQIAASIGKGIRKLKEATTQLSKEFQEAAGEMKDAGKETGGTATPGKGLTKDLGEVTKEIKDVAREINADLETGVGIARGSEEVGRGVQDTAKEMNTVLKPDMGLHQQSKQAAGGTTERMEGVAEDAPGAAGPVRSAKETNGGSEQG